MPSINNHHRSEYAVICGEKRIKKKDFLFRCYLCASYIQTLSLDNGPIAVIHGKTPDLLVLLYSLFLYGIPFVPIDPSYPDARIKSILTDICPSCLIVDAARRDIVCYEKKYVANEIFEAALHSVQSNQSEKIRGFQEVVNEPGLLSTIYFTSGSAGKPKGVMVTKEGLLNHIHGIADVCDLSIVSHTICTASISFDLFFDQAIMPLYYDLTVVLAEDGEHRDPERLVALFKRHPIDYMIATPSTMNLLSLHDDQLMCLEKLQYIIVGGEKCTLSLLKKLQHYCNARIFNAYGPTEASVYATISELTHKETVDVGKPMRNYEIFILDENNKLVEDGCAGEIAISGIGLADGYHGQEDLTNERFIKLPEEKRRVYLTGDIGKIDNGNLVVMGRNDNQTKFNGYRIELEEIEKTIEQIDGVDQCIVAVIEHTNNTSYLLSWYTGRQFDDSAFIAFLQQRLPLYMIPAQFNHLNEFEYTANGKLNRNISYPLTLFQHQKSNAKYSTDRIEDAIINMLRLLLNDSTLNVGLEDRLSSLGITSTHFIQLIVKLEQLLNVEIDDHVLLFSPTESIATLAKRIRGENAQKEPRDC